MKAIVYHGPRDFRVEAVPDPKLSSAADAIVRIQRTAICGSDLHAWHGPALPVSGFALGHEFLGVVEDTGPEVRRFRPGDRVFAACTTGCGSCSMCRRDLYSACEVTTRLAPLTNVFGNPLLQGGQAEAARVPFADANLFRIPESITDEQALFLTDILPTGWLGAELAQVSPGDCVVVFGCGPVGTFAQRAAELRGASRILVVDLDAGRLARARERGYDTLQPEQEPLIERVQEMTHGLGADAVIEAVGHPALIRQAIEVARPGTSIGAIGVVTEEEIPLPFIHGLFAKNLSLRSGLVNPQAFIPTLLPLIEAGRLDPSEIITHRLPLAQGVRGYEIFDAHAEDVLKVVLSA